jgi:Protein of unknown function (DUF3352)
VADPSSSDPSSSEPPSSEPPSGGFAYSLRRRLKRARYRIEDAAIAATRVPRAGIQKARESWSKLSEAARRRVAIAGGAVIAILLIVLVVGLELPCGWPGAGSCPPDDDAAGLVPSDALLYVHVNTDPDSEQYEKAAALAGRLPTLTAQLIASLPGAAGAGVEYDRDVRPWLGGEAAVALVPDGGKAVEQALLLEVGDGDGAEKFIGELVGRRTQGRDYAGVPVTARGGVATAEVGGFLVIGSGESVRAVIDAEGGDGSSLQDDDAAEEVADELPDDSLATGFVSERGAADLFRAGAPLGSLEVFVDSDATTGAGAAVVAGDDGLEVETHSALDPERLESSPGFLGAFAPFDPGLAGELSAESLLYLGLGDPGQSIEALLKQASAEAPGLTEGFEKFSKDLKKDGDVSIEREVLPLLGGEVAVGIEPPPKGGAGAPENEQDVPEGIEPGGPAPIPEEPGELTFTGVPYLVFVAEEVDEEQARKTLADLQVPIARALDPGEGGQAPVFEGSAIAGIQARSLRISPTVNLTYAIFDEKLVVATDPAGIEQVKSGESSLSDSGQYEEATDGFGDELATLLYLNLGDLIALAERQGLAEDPSYALFAPEVRRLQALGLAVERSDEAIATRLRLAIEE